VLGSDILGFVSRNADNFLIGAFLGPGPLGIYATGYRILDVSQRLLINVTRKIAFPVFSRLQHDPPRLARAYLRVSRVAAVLVVPAYVGLALVAPELTVVVFGEKWTDSGPVAAVLFLSGPVLALQAFSGSLLYAAGHPEVVLRYRVITTVANVLGFVVALPFGILAVAAAFTIRGYVFVPLLLVWSRRHAAIPIRGYLGEVKNVVVASLTMAAAVIAVKLIAASVTGLTLLAAEVVAGSVAFLLTLWLLEPSTVRELVAVAEQAIPGIGSLSRRVGGRSRGNAPTPPGGPL
jgi:PST family polysaccharide transporter